jgi:hypothetical protein
MMKILLCYGIHNIFNMDNGHALFKMFSPLGNENVVGNLPAYLHKKKINQLISSKIKFLEATTVFDRRFAYTSYFVWTFERC